MTEDIIVIADTQITPKAPVKHLEALARYIWLNKPKHIVHIGDNWDFPSLNSYNSPLASEGKRLVEDIKAGERALAIIPDYIKKKNRVWKKKKYSPIYNFIEGNHEQRLKTLFEKQPALKNIINLEDIIKKQGWIFNKFLYPLWIEGIAFNHYLQNPMSGKAIGGSIENKLNKISHSFVHGHQQQFQFGRRQSLNGKPHFGVCAGAFYMHDEGYRGACNTEVRGFVHLRSFENRYGYKDYDVEFISLERLLKTY